MFIFPLNKNNNNLFQDDFFIIPSKILIEPHYEMYFFVGKLNLFAQANIE